MSRPIAFAPRVRFWANLRSRLAACSLSLIGALIGAGARKPSKPCVHNTTQIRRHTGFRANFPGALLPPLRTGFLATLRASLKTCLILPACLGQAQAAATALDMPAPASVVGGWTESPSSLGLPIGPYAEGKLPLREGMGLVTQRAYRMDDQRLTTLQLITPLLDQLQRDGYTTVFQCDTSACGGFDFRYGMEVLPEPQMHVDLGDFRYVAATRPTKNGPDMLALLVSKSDDASYVQVTTISALADGAGAPSANPTRIPLPIPPLGSLPASPAPDATASSEAPITQAPTAQAPTAQATDTQTDANQPANPATNAAQPLTDGTPLTPDSFTQGFAASGTVALDDLQFPSSSAALEDKDYASLAALAQWLKANPTQKVMLVGHTDATGALPANTALSLLRAQSVRAALITKLKANPANIDAQGAGYLAPRASNATPEGRAKNRRVEVVLTPTP